jgi:hypothetical protein
MKTMLRIVIGIVIGGALGFANYKFIGCRTGTCPLSGNPWVSTVVGMVFGGSIGGTFQ